MMLGIAREGCCTRRAAMIDGVQPRAGRPPYSEQHGGHEVTAHEKDGGEELSCRLIRVLLLDIPRDAPASRARDRRLRRVRCPGFVNGRGTRDGRAQSTGARPMLRAARGDERRLPACF